MFGRRDMDIVLYLRAVAVRYVLGAVHRSAALNRIVCVSAGLFSTSPFPAPALPSSVGNAYVRMYVCTAHQYSPSMHTHQTGSPAPSPSDPLHSPFPSHRWCKYSYSSCTDKSRSDDKVQMRHTARATHRLHCTSPHPTAPTPGPRPGAAATRDWTRTTCDGGVSA